jgi:hypothetical protein
MFAAQKKRTNKNQSIVDELDELKACWLATGWMK